jgi:branched-chain amino acid transport system permease protein
MKEMISLETERRIGKRSDGTILNRIVRSILILASLLILYSLIRAASDNLSIFLQQVLNGLQLGFIYALIALGYTMIYGVAKLINFAHGDVVMIGAFTSFFAISVIGLEKWPMTVFPTLNKGIAEILGTASVIIVSMVVCGVLAITMERFAYRPLRKLPSISSLITAIGVSFFIEYFAALPFVYTNNYVTYERPFEFLVVSADILPDYITAVAWVVFVVSMICYLAFTWLAKRGKQRYQARRRSPLLHLGLLLGGFSALVLTLLNVSVGGEEGWMLTVSNIMLVIMVSSILLQVLLQNTVQYTRLGRAMRACAYDKEAARLMGINVDQVITTTFALGGGLAGAAGVLYATAFKQVHYLLGVIPGLKAFVAAVIGGIGSIPGALVGALIMGETEVLSAAYISTPMRDAIAFSLLIIVLLIRPQGIFGEGATEKV